MTFVPEQSFFPTYSMSRKGDFVVYTKKKFKYRLQFVMSLISRVFGVRVVGVKKNRSKKYACNAFKVEPSELFRWAGDRWVVPEKEKVEC